VKRYSSREVIKILQDDGWYLDSIKGDHHQYEHKSKKGKVTVRHPVKDLTDAEIKSISKQSGIQF
jgi:predicted RNA binding protein YcfA (HicA-like mRNA interferase family)